MKKSFTITELLVSIAIISILGAITITAVSLNYEDSKKDIVNIANNKVYTKIIRNGEIIEEGYSLDTSGYIVIDVTYKDGVVIITVE